MRVLVTHKGNECLLVNVLSEPTLAVGCRKPMQVPTLVIGGSPASFVTVSVQSLTTDQLEVAVALERGVDDVGWLDR